MIKMIIFDVDGVINNAERFSIYLERDFGIDSSITNKFFYNDFQQCLIGKADLKVSIEPYLKEWGWKKSVDELLDYWFKVEHSINEDLMKYIQRLRKQRMVCIIATNQEKYRTEYIWRKMGFSNSFDKIYSSAHLGYTKASIEFYKKVLRDFISIDKDEVLFWDDDIRNIEEAKKFGIKAELYTNDEDFKKKMKKYLI